MFTLGQSQNKKKNLNAKLEKEKTKLNLHDTERNKDQIPFKNTKNIKMNKGQII